MDEKSSPPVSGPTARASRRRFEATVDGGGGGGGERMECSGKFWRSCTAGTIADCVAICCCPCAVLHCFALAFVKAPWVAGRRCFGRSKRAKNGKSKCCHGGDVAWERERDRDRDGNTMEDSVSVNAGFEAEKLWLELYQIGHLDFGRVSSFSLHEHQQQQQPPKSHLK